MDYLKLLERMSNNHERKLPFVLFSLPDSEELTLMAQNDDKLHSTTDYQ